MKKRSALLLALITVFLSTFSVFSESIDSFTGWKDHFYTATDYQPPKGGMQYGLGKYDGTGITIFGDFKDCATNAFFYLLTVNSSDEEILVRLPNQLFIHDRNYDVSQDSYTYKDLGADWRPEGFADAIKGEPLDSINDSYQFKLPAHTTYSIMGEITALAHETLREISSQTGSEDLAAYGTIQFGNTTMVGQGYLHKEGDTCSNIVPQAFQGNNYVFGGYQIDPTGTNICSLSFYLKANNTDNRYTTVVELPQYIELNGSKWDIGCKIIDDTCKTPGLSHFAFKEDDEEGRIVDSQFTFCDKDLNIGDPCYDQDGLWWLKIPPGKTYLIRSMVNDLCSSPQRDIPNPLMEKRVSVRVHFAESGSHQRMMYGEIDGYDASNSQTNETKNYNQQPPISSLFGL